jgi:KDO2-lipid IV(A) lauroyltransferase
LRYGCELVPVRTRRLQDANFEVTLYPPVHPDDIKADEVEQARQMTLKINAMFEQWIRETPEDWFCTKRRWAKDAAPANSDTSIGTEAKSAENPSRDVAGLS